MTEDPSRTSGSSIFFRHDKDHGSAAVQVSNLTSRISALTLHLKTHKKDHSSKRGLLMLVGQRRRLLRYLKRKDHHVYSALLSNLNLKKVN